MGRFFNNRFNKRVYEEMPHTFTLIDIDGVIVLFNPDGTRLIIIEHKEANEKIGYMQMKVLKLLDKLIDWNKLDRWSGIYILRETDYKDIYIFSKIDGSKKWKISFEQLKKLFTGEIK